MLSPAFEMQYSARFTEAAYAETEVMKTIRPHPRSSIQPAASAVRKCGPFRLVAISSSKLSSEASSTSRRSRGAMLVNNAGMAALARVADQRGAVRGGRHIAPHDIGAGLSGQVARRRQIALISGNHAMRARQFRGDRAADSPAGAGDDANGLGQGLRQGPGRCLSKFPRT